MDSLRGPENSLFMPALRPLSFLKNFYDSGRGQKEHEQQAAPALSSSPLVVPHLTADRASHSSSSSVVSSGEDLGVDHRSALNRRRHRALSSGSSSTTQCSTTSESFLYYVVPIQASEDSGSASHASGHPVETEEGEDACSQQPSPIPRLEMHRLRIQRQRATAAPTEVQGGEAAPVRTVRKVENYAARETLVRYLEDETEPELRGHLDLHSFLPLAFPSPSPPEEVVRVLESVFIRTAVLHYTQCPLCSPREPLLWAVVTGIPSFTESDLPVLWTVAASSNSSSSIADLLAVYPLPRFSAVELEKAISAVLTIGKSNQCGISSSPYFKYGSAKNAQYGERQPCGSGPLLGTSPPFWWRFLTPGQCTGEEDTLAHRLLISLLQRSESWGSSSKKSYRMLPFLQFFIAALLSHRDCRQRLLTVSTPLDVQCIRDPTLTHCDHLGGMGLVESLLLSIGGEPVMADPTGRW